MKQQALVVTIISLITILFSLDMAEAGRTERSRVNREKAQAWCAEYTRTHSGEECHVVVMISICPKGFRKAKRFNRIRSNGYKTCIRGKKGHSIKKAVKKMNAPVVKPTRKVTRGTVKATKKTTKAGAKGVKNTSRPVANRVKHSRRNHKEAREWCANYTRTHGGAECRVKRMVRGCPTAFPRVAKKFKKFRSRGYKACVQ